jgi:hypothetical protein
VIAPLKLKTILPYDLAILPQAYTQSNWKQGLKDILYKHSHSNIIPNIQKEETTQVFINKWVDR